MLTTPLLLNNKMLITNVNEKGLNYNMKKGPLLKENIFPTSP